MLNQLKTVIQMARITYSSKYAMKIANQYWQSTTITHTSMEESEFDFYYQKILKILLPKKNENILDYGGGNGEIAFRFQNDGFTVEHCDISNKMVQNAISKYNLKSSVCSEFKNQEYNKILFHNAFFYVHPSLAEKLLVKLHLKLVCGGKLYITDTPDFEKRTNLGLNKLHIFFTFLFPVYQITMSGFYIKNSDLCNLGKKIGFKVEKSDSWCSYRSHWILTKI
jgi:cyclopropane fatty-acyl-phospholipid synthase-like methyltransferase